MMLEPQPPGAGPAATRADRSPMTDAAPRATPRVLLAEDNRDLLLILSRQLAHLGLEVHSVSNGRDAVDQALGALSAGDPFDLILMDLEMPVLDGYQATRLLREAGMAGPILALTAHSGEDAQLDGLSLGYNGHLCKPFTWEQLRDFVMKFLRPAQAPGEPPAPPR